MILKFISVGQMGKSSIVQWTVVLLIVVIVEKDGASDMLIFKMAISATNDCDIDIVASNWNTSWNDKICTSLNL